MTTPTREEALTRLALLLLQETRPGGLLADLPSLDRLKLLVTAAQPISDEDGALFDQVYGDSWRAYEKKTPKKE